MVHKKNKIAQTATEALKILWEDGFLRSWRKTNSIKETLSKMDHNFSDAELGMALKRAKHLTRRGKRGTYEYIQKYPFIAEPLKSDKKG